MVMLPQNNPMITSSGVVGVARMGAGLIPGVGHVADLALAPVQGTLESQEELDRLSREFGIRDITKEMHGSASVQKHVEKQGRNWLKLTTVAGGGVGGSVLGAMIGTALIPIPFVGTGIGLIAGGIGGSMLTDYVYAKTTTVPNEDSILLVQQMHANQKVGQGALPELVFAAIAGNMRGAAGKRMEDELEKLTGTRDFNTAFSQGRIEALHSMMMTHDAAVRADVGMAMDLKNPTKSASEQLADWINFGGLDARRLIIRKFGLPTQSLEQTPQPQMIAQTGGMGIDVPSLPLGQNAAKGVSI